MIRILPKRTACAMFGSIRGNGEWGSGKGKGGGSGGAIRDAGGSFGKMEATREEEYFRRQQQEQIQKLKGHLNEEIESHQNLVQKLQDEIQRHKDKITELNKEAEKMEK